MAAVRAMYFQKHFNCVEIKVQNHQPPVVVFNKHGEEQVQGLLLRGWSYISIYPSNVAQWGQLGNHDYKLFIFDDACTLYAAHFLTQADNVIVTELAFPKMMFFSINM